MARMSREGLVLQDLTMRFQVYLERVKTGQLADIDDVIREFSAIAEKALPANATLTQRWKVQDTVRSMQTKMRAVAKRYKKKFMESLDEVAVASATNEVNAVNLVAPKKKAKAPSKNALKKSIRNNPIQATGTNMEAFVDTWSESAVRRVSKEVVTGAAQGLTNQEIVRRIRGTRANNFRDGILGNATKREANAMVRTAVQHAASEATREMYRDNDDIIEGYRWISTLDSRTSSQCRALDLEQFEIGKGPVPPLHINCRSSTIPKIEGVDLLSHTTRASEDGQVPADMSYYEWLQSKDPEFQDEVLGPRRGELFRRDDMTPSKFAEEQLDTAFAPLSVEELSEKVGVVDEDLIPFDSLDPATQEFLVHERRRLDDFADRVTNVTYEDFTEVEAPYWDFEPTEAGYAEWRAFMSEQVSEIEKLLGKYSHVPDEVPTVATALEKHVAGAVREGFSTAPSASLPVGSHFKTMEEVSEFWLEYEKAGAINHILAGGTNPQQFFQSPLTDKLMDKLNEAAHILRNATTELRDTKLLRGSVFLDEKELMALFPEGKVVNTKRFLSATTDRGIAEQYMDPQFIGGDDSSIKVLFTINGRMRGYRLQLPSDYGKWDEVLLPPGTEFHVARYIRHEDYIEVILEVVE